MMKKLFKGVFALATLLFLQSIIIAQTLPIDTTDGWYLNWNDEFDYPDEQLDDNWISANGSTNDLLLCTRWRENAEVKDGILEITARKVEKPEENKGKDWTAGSIWTKSNDFKYGYYEARYKYAAATGTNNSFWLYPYSKADAGYNKVELDINEGRFPNIIKTNIHNWTAGDAEVHPLQKFHNVDTESDLGEEYHTYGLLWTATEHIIYVDGEEIRREDNPAYLQKNPNNTDGSWVYVENHGKTQILLSLAILPSYYSGPVTDSIDGKSMKVDYVRYYKNDNINAINELETGEVVAYPNPAFDELYFDNAEMYIDVKIYNQQGLLVNQESLYNEKIVNVSNIENGLYYYVLEGNKGKTSGVFIKNSTD